MSMSFVYNLPLALVLGLAYANESNFDRGSFGDASWREQHHQALLTSLRNLRGHRRKLAVHEALGRHETRRDETRRHLDFHAHEALGDTVDKFGEKVGSRSSLEPWKRETVEAPVAHWRGKVHRKDPSNRCWFDAAELGSVSASPLDTQSGCKSVILAPFLNGKADWQSGKRLRPGFRYMEKFFKSVMSQPKGSVKAIIVHDGLDDDLTEDCELMSDGAVSFHKVNMSDYDSQLGLNDVRFAIFRDLLRNHTEWETVFMTDLGDVEVKHNPCELVASSPGKLFVGLEPNDLKPNGWVKDRFDNMGGKYKSWYAEQTNGTDKILNAGVVGGMRERLIELLDGIYGVMEDPELEARQLHKAVNVNMAALNYVIRSNYSMDDLLVGWPLTTKFKGYEVRPDVMFKHKLLL